MPCHLTSRKFCVFSFLLALQWPNLVNKWIKNCLSDRRMLCHNHISCHMTLIKVIFLLLLVLRWPNLVWKYINICWNDHMMLHFNHVSHHATSIKVVYFHFCDFCWYLTTKAGQEIYQQMFQWSKGKSGLSQLLKFFFIKSTNLHIFSFIAKLISAVWN